MSEFVYQEPVPLGPATTRYRLVTKDHVSVIPFDGVELLRIEPDALALLSRD